MFELKISIITVCYNNLAGLKQTMSSIWNQSYRNLETVVVDGGSEDGSLDFLNYNKKIISKFFSEPDRGIYDAMNKGLYYASGDFCIFLNAGDVFISNTIVEEFASKMIDEGALYFGRALIVGEFAEWFLPESNVNEGNYLVWLKNYEPNHQAMFFPKCFYKNNLYDLRIKYASDTDYKRRAYRSVKFIFLDRLVCKFFLGGSSNSGSLKVSLRQIKDHFIIKRKNSSLTNLNKAWIIFSILAKYILNQLGKSFYHNVIRWFAGGAFSKKIYDFLNKTV